MKIIESNKVKTGSGSNACLLNKSRENREIKASIIVPIYNVEKYLDKSLGSIFKQTEENIEIVCVNDGSSDGSFSLLKKYRELDKRIVIISQTNRGLAGARNTGIRHAKGEYIFFVDADDTIAENTIELVTTAMSSNNSDIAVFGIEPIGSKDKDLLNWIETVNPKETKHCNNIIPEFIFDERSTHPFVWRNAFKRDFLKKSKILFDEKCLFGEDIIFQKRAFALATRVSLIKDKLYNYLLVRDGSLMEHVNKDIRIKFNEHVRLSQLLNKYLERYKTEETFKVKFCNFISKFVYEQYSLLGERDKRKVSSSFLSMLQEISDGDEKYLDKNIIIELKTNSFIEKSEISFINKTFITEKQSPLISILVPVYNNPDFLYDCLSSIVNQTFKDIEIIIINDGSTNEKSIEIMNDFKKLDSRIILINKRNTGYGNSMNIGLAKARGKYIGIVESDDFIANDMFEILYCISEKYSLEVLKASFYNYNTETKEIEEKNIFENERYNRVLEPVMYLKNPDMQPAIWATLYRKSFLEKHKIKFNETPGASYQDLGFHILYLILAKRFMFIKKPLYYYRIDNPNSSVASDSKVFAVRDELEYVDKYLDNNKIRDENVTKLVNYIRFLHYKWNYHRLHDENQKNFFNSYLEALKKIDYNEVDSEQQEYIKNFVNGLRK